MDEIWARFSDNLIGRLSGPMRLRLIMQPLMASIMAFRSGLADARRGRPPYLWSLFSDRAGRRQRIREGWGSVGSVFILAVLLDSVYQVMQFRFVYPGEAVVVAFILAILPYLTLRGLVTRLVRRT